MKAAAAIIVAALAGLYVLTGSLLVLAAAVVSLALCLLPADENEE